ncbi:PREDICTED: hematopoietic SH2 domain-containing protein [Chrysochloris asiatica]|uniref:Hematopoietic SH2 domain-containing protein n=1 Tax=Chrysochloris asiatica TaxID=185453 RepID=A0A9B0UBU1_CHRAS|nr:PREDICTED: hematopoietic SH2 domain-containing protein [Chrysochloris asiatica]
MTEDRNLSLLVPPRLDWFVHTQVGQLAQDGVPTWFHGAISREAAENLLKPQPPGSFLIRVSHSHVGYTLSYKAQDSYRHFMVKLLDDGSFVIPGTRAAHTSLDALVTFHQQEPMQPYGELLTQPCGQEDPENVDYEDLFLFSNTLAEEVAIPAHGRKEDAFPKQGLLYWPKKRTSSAEVDRVPSGNAGVSCPTKASLGGTRQKLWKSLKTLPQAGRKVQQQLKSHLTAMSLPLLWNSRWSSAPHSSGARASNCENTANWEDSICTAPFEGAQGLHCSPRDRNALSREPLRSVSWSGVSPGDRSLHSAVVRSPSLQVSEQEMRNLTESQDWLPEEYLPPPPFAPGYC